jgi:hypothetical protein
MTVTGWLIVLDEDNRWSPRLDGATGACRGSATARVAAKSGLLALRAAC